MKFMTDRHEIAEAINIKMMPVITIDISECMNGYEHCYEGSKVRVATPSKRYPDSTRRCEVKMYGDEAGNRECHDTPWMYKKIVLTCGCVGLSDSFGYSDVMEMVEYANKPVLHAGDEVIVIFDNNKRRECHIRRMKVGNHIDAHCQTVATLVDIDEK